MLIRIGDRIVGIKNKETVRGNVRAVNGDSIHVMMNGRMYLLQYADLQRVNGKKIND